MQTTLAPWTEATSRGPGLGVPGRLHQAPAPLTAVVEIPLEIIYPIMI